MNPILELDWEKDIPDPIFHLVEHCGISSCDVSSGMHFYPPTDILRVQADPQDIIKFNKVVLGDEIYHATSATWRWTLDRYIHLYYQLARQRDSGKTITHYVSTNTVTKIENALNRPKAKRPITTTIVSRRHMQGVCPDDSEREGIKFEKFAHAAAINSFYWDHAVRPDADDIRSSLCFNGLLFPDAPVPTYRLEDYVEHELQTGVSLSIEIASVLSKFGKTNSAFVNDVLEIFSQKLLPQLLQCPFFFTRNTVARLFFLQILSEQTLYSCSLEGITGTDYIKSSWFQDTLSRALSHMDILYPLPDEIVLPNEEIDSALQHIESLLRNVSCPINLLEYVEAPTHGFALFCHPLHDEVSNTYFDFLEKTHLNPTKKAKRLSDRIKLYSSEKTKLYSTVQRKVLETLKQFRK